VSDITVAESFHWRFVVRTPYHRMTKGAPMPCYLLHMIEMPLQRPYDDPDVKDVVGDFPQLFCAHCNPPRNLRPSESTRCLNREAPCWKPRGDICPSPG
jgi:hypothetical protein